MSLLTKEIKAQVRQALADLTTAVQLIVFTQTLECPFCRETRELLEDIAGLSDHISVQVYNFVNDVQQAEKYGIDKIPALVILGEKDYGIRFYGIPAGYEFTSLIHAIRLVGGVGSQLDQATIDELQALSEPVHLQVFVTPTCPYCPQAVVLGFEMAFASPKVSVDAIESSEFQPLAIKYQVAGVPLTIINEKTRLEGAAPVPLVMDKIKETVTVEE